MHERQKYRQLNDPTAYKLAFLHATPISLFIIGLFYYWFALANRYTIFLYYHLGATPFDERTSSRYWMSGLVASGAVMVMYTMTNWFWGRIAGLRNQSYAPPVWWRVWLLCAMPLTISIMAITMSLNQPTLPLSNALACVLATLLGLGLALLPGSLAAQHPLELGWLIVIASGLVPSLLLLRAIELPSRGFPSKRTTDLIAIGSTLAGAAWSTVAARLQVWRCKLHVDATKLLAASLCLSYLLMPLVHYLLLTPPEFHYISASTNFFAMRWSTQLMVFCVVGTMAAVLAQLQQRWHTTIARD